ncbi:MAG: Glycerol kinase [Gammaproteobacteria bacterium]|nr:Glycerol kinase [Gammaproteobacteria bacterium]
MNAIFIGIDIGTQSLKATVVANDLRVLASASRGYEARYPKPGWAEQDPKLWEAAMAPAICAALEEAGVGPATASAIGIAGQLDGCIAVDRQDEPLGPCLIWLDRRAALPDRKGLADDIHRRCGIVADPGHMGAKIAWLQRNGAGQAVRFHQPVSYIVNRLTGRAVMDYALASTTMLYDLATRAWSPELLEAFGVDAEELPELAEAYEPAGRLNNAGSGLTGLPKGIPVAVGTGDDFSTPLGAGIVRPGRLACVLGTAEVVGALDTEAKIDEEGLLETHAYVGGHHFIENPGWYAGGAIEWFLKNHRIADPAEFNDLASRAPAGSGGVLFLPALSGAMAPEWNPAARACFYGLTAAHGLPHMARAVMEGCAFAMRDVVERLQSLGVPLEAIRLLGGGARSRLWAQIRADTVQLPVELPGEVDTSPIGAAMLAAVAGGGAPDIVTAAEARNDVQVVVQPGDGGAYDAAYTRYRALFKALKPVFDLGSENP